MSQITPFTPATKFLSTIVVPPATNAWFKIQRAGPTNASGGVANLPERRDHAPARHRSEYVRICQRARHADHGRVCPGSDWRTPSLTRYPARPVECATPDQSLRETSLPARLHMSACSLRRATSQKHCSTPASQSPFVGCHQANVSENFTRPATISRKPINFICIVYGIRFA